MQQAQVGQHYNMAKRPYTSTPSSTPKRRRWSPVQSGEDEDEIPVATSNIAASQEDGHLESGQIRDSLRFAGFSAANGMLTPLSAESRSGTLRKKAIAKVQPERSNNSSAEDSPSPPPSPTPTPHSNPSSEHPCTVQRVLSHVDFPGWENGPCVPRRLYGWRPKNVEESAEHRALKKLVEAHERMHADAKPDYTYITLDQFSIYRPANSYKHAHTLVSLHELSRDRYQEFCFDGVLSVGQERYFVQDVRFRTLTVDGYDESEATDMENQLCIQSLLGARQDQDVWYKLGTPGMEYRRFYRPFLWIARFTKHVVHYMLTTKGVTLQHFRRDFYNWMDAIYGQESSFSNWLSVTKTTDFAIHFVAYADFLWKESHGVQRPEDDIRICEHPIWCEVLPYPDHLKAIPRQPSKQSGQPKTIVTPFAYESFKNMYFADQMMEGVVSEPEILRRIADLKARRGLTPWHPGKPSPVSKALRLKIDEIAAGDVVAVPPDKGGRWKSAAASWYAYVQRVWVQKNGQKRLDVIWLYHPEDTTIGKARYLFPNELFFSDNCGCGVREALHIQDVTHKVSVTWNPRNPFAQDGFFTRQKFRTVAEMDYYDFIKLRSTDFRCCHQVGFEAEPTSKYKVGDTVLVQKRKDALGRNCEPAQILGFSEAGSTVQLRKFARKADTSPSSRPNELLVTTETFSGHCDKLVRECHIREFTDEQIKAGLPTPYDRDGAGDYFFVIVNGAGDDQHVATPKLQQAWDPEQATSQRKLRGLGIFCGGGIFDRGLQEGGAVRFTHAVDYAEHALHSYRANATEPVKFFLGSVDDYLSNVMSGQSHQNTATPGEIDLISAGSPCGGFSRLQLNTASTQSKKNASMVASVVSFVDVYVPKYLLLENVISMTESVKERKEQNVFSQILAALVGLGYQVQQFLMDSWSHGSSQQRSRVFIIARAPSAAPLPQPECTHAHPTKNFRIRHLGKSANGLPFGTRRTEPFVPFPYVTAEEAVADLPKIYDSVPQLCAEFPDHRLAMLEVPEVRARIAMIPTRPRGWGMIEAEQAGKLRGEPAEYFENRNKKLIGHGITSKAYTRVHPDHLFPTIVTRLLVGDGMNGRTLHWDQHRPLTVMEARRALGYLDHEVLIGTPDKQFHIVGNSVDRKVALVLGLALRDSWLKSSDRNLSGDTHMDDSATGMSAAGKRNAPHFDNDSARAAMMSQDGASSTASETPSMDDTDSDDPDSELNIDNRSVKMALNLTQEEIQRIRSATEERRGGFKEILRLMQEKGQLATRQSQHSTPQGGMPLR